MEEGLTRRKSADEGGNGEKPMFHFFRIPLAIALLGFTIIVAGAISIPLGVLSFKGADQSIDEVTSVLRTRIVGEFESSVRSLLASCLNAAEDTRSSFVVNKFIREYLRNNSVPLDTFENEFLTSFTQRAGRYQSTIGIAVANGDPGNLPEQYFVGQPGTFGKRCIGIGNPGGFSCSSGLWQLDNSTLYQPKLYLQAFGPPAFSAADKPKVVPVKGIWTPGMFINLGGKLTGAKHCAHYTWARNPVPPSGYGSNWDLEFSSVYKLDRITDYLAEMDATPNTRMALIEINGDIMATNKANAQYNEYKNGSVTLDMCTDSILKSAGKEILSRFQAYTATPSTFSGKYKSDQDGTVYLDFVRLRDDQQLDMLAVLAVPEDDLLGVMKRTRKAATISVSIIAVVMLLVAGCASYLFTLPLKRLTNVMVAATSFDFSSVRDKKRANQRSFIHEISVMENVFATMLLKFARAIESNKSLMGTKAVTSTAKSGEQSVVSQR